MSDLADEREFLLRSLEDLDRERAEGNLDDAQYASLHADYTARAAAVLRAMEHGGAPLDAPARDPRATRRRVLTWVGIVGFAADADQPEGGDRDREPEPGGPIGVGHPGGLPPPARPLGQLEPPLDPGPHPVPARVGGLERVHDHEEVHRSDRRDLRARGPCRAAGPPAGHPEASRE